MNTWGLTGGIASGKSTVGAMLAAHQIPVVNADALYHALIAPREGHASELSQAIAGVFGEAVLSKDGALDRKMLAARAFTDAAARRHLEALTHPAIQTASQGALEALAEAGHPVAIYDVPLLFENRLEGRFSAVVLVWVPAEVQRARLRHRDGASDAAIKARLAAQLPLDDKRSRAHWVIDNGGEPDATSRQVEALAAAMRADPGGRRLARR